MTEEQIFQISERFGSRPRRFNVPAPVLKTKLEPVHIKEPLPKFILKKKHKKPPHELLNSPYNEGAPNTLVLKNPNVTQTLGSRRPSS